MKPRAVLYLSVLIFLLLACACPAINLPVRVTTVTPSQDSSGVTPGRVTAPPPPSSQEAPFNMDWNDRTAFEKNLASTSKVVLSDLPGASVYHIAFSLSDPPTQIDGIEEVRYTNTEDVALSEVNFAVFSEILGGGITIHSLTLEGRDLPTTHKSGILRVSLPESLQPGQAVTFHIEFSVTVPSQGGNFYYGIFGYNDTILSMAHAYPTILVYDQNGWNNQSPDLDGDPLFSDTSFYLVSVDAPRDLVLAGAGVEIERSETGDRQHVLYSDGPARDFYLVASAGFQKTSKKVGELTINSYTLQAESGYAQNALNDAATAIQDFSKRYAPYPYTEFDVAPIVTMAGGVEFPGMTVIAEEVYSSGPFLEDVIAHEVAHQWFYNLVGNETQRQPWLDESMAQFLTWQYFLDEHGSQGAQLFQQEIQGNWDSLKDQKIPIGEPVSSYTSQEYVAIVYGRGPFFLLALRQQMGTDRFDSFMSDYAHSYAWKIAMTDDFKALAEKHCACNLTKLFNQWVTP
jgi:hypothetical protein